MFNFHLDRYEYFQTQIINTEKYVIPFVEKHFGLLTTQTNVLEVGCAEGGVLKAFVNRGCTATGVELSELRFSQSSEFLKVDIGNGTVMLYNNNIFDDNLRTKFIGKFDIIILKDVIEHISEKEVLLTQLGEFLREKGVIYFGFPPWAMPFGGHQQICKSKFLSRLPWFHLLPNPLYKTILNGFGEYTEGLMEIKDTGISINSFEKLVKKSGYEIKGCTYYLINPIYEFKFKLKPREQFQFISKIPLLKDFFTTCVYYVIEKDPLKSKNQAVPKSTKRRTGQRLKVLATEN